jgi:hypothetical protein
MNREGHSIKFYDKQKNSLVDVMIYNQITEKDIDDYENS